MRRILHVGRRPKRNHKDENLPALPHKNKTCWERIWTDVEQGEYSLFDYAVSKKLIHRLRHGKQVHRERGACSPWAEAGVVRRERDESFLVAFPDQDVYRLFRSSLFDEPSFESCVSELYKV